MQRDAGLLGRGGQRVGRHVGVRDAGRAGGDRDAASWRRVAASGLALRAPVLLRRASGLTTPSTSATTSSGVGALRSDSTKSLRTSARARLDSSFMCSAPPDSGAAIRNARSAGPSGAPKSTGGFSRAKPIEAVSTCGERQCGIAMPPGRPVADCSSRAMAAADAARRRRWRARRRRGVCTSRPITACLSPPASASSRTRSVVMIDGGGAGHGTTFVVGGGWLIGAIGEYPHGVEVDLAGRGSADPGQRGRGAAVGDRHPQPLRRIGAADLGADVAGEGGVAGADGAARRDGRRGGQPAAGRRRPARRRRRRGWRAPRRRPGRSAAGRGDDRLGITLGDSGFQCLRREPEHAGELFGVRLDAGRERPGRTSRPAPAAGASDVSTATRQRNGASSRDDVARTSCRARRAAANPDSTTQAADSGAGDHGLR